MAFKELGEVRIVQLGGTNPNTGEANPTEVEGYYLRKELRENKFNKKVPQAFYILQTQHGDVGIYGKASIDKGMNSASVGTMTKIVATGEELDVGKGNPMKVYKVFQDPTNTIEVAATLGDEPETEEEDDNTYTSTPTKPTAGLGKSNLAAESKIRDMLKKRA